MNSALSRRLMPLYVAAFFQAFNLWFAIEKLFMRQIGFDDAAIALAVVLFTVVTLLVETPSGLLADRWSRKGVLVIASVAMIVCSILCGLSDSVLMYTLAIMLIGVYYAMYSGTYESLVYDTIVDIKGSSDGYEKTYGNVQILSAVALISGSLLSGVLATVTSLSFVYFLTVPFMLLSIIALLFYKEPRLHKPVKPARIKTQIRATFAALHKDDSTKRLVIGLVLLGVSSALIFEFNQLWYLALAFPIIYLGVGNALVQACLGFGGALAGRLFQSPLLMTFTTTGLLVGSIALTVDNAMVVMTGQVALQTLLIALTIIVSKRLHDTLESTNRAGSISAVSTMTKLLFLPLALLLGTASQYISIFDAAWILVALAGLITITLNRIFRVYHATEDVIKPA